MPFDEWQAESTEALNMIYDCMQKMPDTSKKKVKQFMHSVVEQQYHYALGKYISYFAIWSDLK